MTHEKLPTGEKTSIERPELTARDFVDYLRAALTVMTWYSLSAGVTYVIWNAPTEAPLFGILGYPVIAMALLTSLGGAAALWVLTDQLQKKVLARAHWLAVIPLAFFGPTLAFFFFGSCTVILLVPILKSIAG